MKPHPAPPVRVVFGPSIHEEQVLRHRHHDRVLAKVVGLSYGVGQQYIRIRHHGVEHRGVGHVAGPHTLRTREGTENTTNLKIDCTCQ